MCSRDRCGVALLLVERVCSEGVIFEKGGLEGSDIWILTNIERFGLGNGLPGYVLRGGGGLNWKNGSLMEVVGKGD